MKHRPTSSTSSRPQSAAVALPAYCNTVSCCAPRLCRWCRCFPPVSLSGLFMQELDKRTKCNESRFGPGLCTNIVIYTWVRFLSSVDWHLSELCHAGLLSAARGLSKLQIELCPRQNPKKLSRDRAIVMEWSDGWRWTFWTCVKTRWTRKLPPSCVSSEPSHCRHDGFPSCHRLSM